MRKDTVVQLRQPGTFSEDPLTEVLRLGARRLLARAVEMEVTTFVEMHADLTDGAGRRRIVRHGYLPEREIQTGIGPVAVRCPRVRDRGGGEMGPRIRFTSSILPPYLRRAKSIEELLPWLYLKGISTGDFSEALAALLGPEAPGLSASTIVRLKEVWQGEMEHWQRRDLSARRYVYFWADGIYFSPRLDDKQCILVIIGADELGRKELLAIADGYRESAQSWREVLLDLKRRGLAIAPELASGDGALGFWKALREVYGTTREQRCWVHKTANVLNKLPKSVQPRAKQHLQDIWMAETKRDAEKAFDFFLEAYGAKYDDAFENGGDKLYHRAECLTHVGDSQAVRSLTQCGEPMRFAMAAPIDLRNDFDSVSLRRLAKRTRDATQSRRLLALAEVYDGGSRTDASRIGGVGLQIIRDWVLRFNARGPDGLVDGKSPGAPSKLNADHRRALAEVVEAGPVPAVDGVVRWRRKDLARWLLETFAISLDETTVGRELKALGFAKISARPRHYAQNELAVEAFKKTSPPNWRRSGRGSRKASR